MAITISADTVTDPVLLRGAPRTKLAIDFMTRFTINKVDSHSQTLAFNKYNSPENDERVLSLL